MVADSASLAAKANLTTIPGAWTVPAPDTRIKRGLQYSSVTKSGKGPP